MPPETPAPAHDAPKGKRTEWITREYTADGDLVSETVTVKTEITPVADAQQWPGGYL
jgi:hypothetical protein